MACMLRQLKGDSVVKTARLSVEAAVLRCNAGLVAALPVVTENLIRDRITAHVQSDDAHSLVLPGQPYPLDLEFSATIPPGMRCKDI